MYDIDITQKSTVYNIILRKNDKRAVYFNDSLSIKCLLCRQKRGSIGQTLPTFNLSYNLKMEQDSCDQTFVLFLQTEGFYSVLDDLIWYAYNSEQRRIRLLGAYVNLLFTRQ